MHLLLWSGFNPGQGTEILQALQWGKENKRRNETEKWTKQKISCLRFSSVQSLSCVLLCNPVDCCSQASLSITKSQSLLQLMSIESVMPSSNHFIPCRPLLLLPSICPSIRVFSNESVLGIRWPKYWSFSLSISPSNEYSGLISLRTDWLDLLAVQGTLKCHL